MVDVKRRNNLTMTSVKAVAWRKQTTAAHATVTILNGVTVNGAYGITPTITRSLTGLFFFFFTFLMKLKKKKKRGKKEAAYVMRNREA